MGSIREHTVIKVLDEGRFGAVSLIKITGFKKEFVLKEIDLRDASLKEQRAAKLEAKLLETLRHENIVSYIESFLGSNGCLHIIMEYCRGGDLYQCIKKRNGVHFSEQRVAGWLSQICQALKYLHDRNILHRDLKTKNIFLSETGDIRVGDLGIARVLKDRREMAETMVGTPCYMSPEIFCQRPYNHKCDIWSLGCCMLEVMTLKQAFSALTYEALRAKVLDGNVPAVPEQYSSELVDLVLSFLTLDPEKRPSVSDILLTGYMRHHNMDFARVKVSNCKTTKVERNEKKLKNRESIVRKLKNGEVDKAHAIHESIMAEKLSSMSLSEEINGRKSEISCTDCKTSSSSSISLNSVVTTPDINGNGDGNDNSQRTYTLRAEDDAPEMNRFRNLCIYVNSSTPNSHQCAKGHCLANSKENINPTGRQNVLLPSNPSVAQSAICSRKPPLKILPKKPSTSMSVYKVPKNAGQISLEFLNHLQQALKRARGLNGSSSNFRRIVSTKLCLHSPSLPNLRDSCLFCEPDYGSELSSQYNTPKVTPCSCGNTMCSWMQASSKNALLGNKVSGSVPVLPLLSDCSVLPRARDVLNPRRSFACVPHNDTNIDNYLIKDIVTGNKNWNCAHNIAARQRRRKKEMDLQSQFITKSAPASVTRFPPIPS